MAFNWEENSRKAKNYAQQVFLDSVEKAGTVRNCMMLVETTRACDPDWKICEAAIDKSVEMIRETKSMEDYNLVVRVLNSLSIPIPQKVTDLLKEIQ